MNQPLCFTSPQVFRLWLSVDPHIPENMRCKSGPCTDCQPLFQLRMKRLGRCEHPETTFKVDRYGKFYGVWPT